MRTTKELLEVMLENIDSLESGLCILIHKLVFVTNDISFEEHVRLDEYLKENLPDKTFSYEYDPPRFSFPWGEKEPRIKWLKEQIQLLDEKDKGAN